MAIKIPNRAPFGSVLPDQDRDPLTPYEYNAPSTQFGTGYASAVNSMRASQYAGRAYNAEVAGDKRTMQYNQDLMHLFQDYSERVAPKIASLKDVDSLSTAADYAAGMVGQGVASIGASIGAGLAGTALGGPVGGFAAAAATSGVMAKDDMLRTQYLDPTLSQASPEDRGRVANVVGIASGALDALGVGKLLSKGGFAGKMLTEGATETLQEGANYLGERSLDPEREADRYRFLDAFAGGALTGGAVSGTTAMARQMVNIARADRVAQNREQFIKEAFKPEVDDAPRKPAELSEDMTVETTGETLAKMDAHNAALDAATVERAERLIEDPTTPVQVQDRIKTLDLSDPEVQMEIAALEDQWRVAKQTEDMFAAAQPLAEQSAQVQADRAKRQAVLDKLSEQFKEADAEGLAQVADVLAKFDSDQTNSVYEASPVDLSNLKRIAEVTQYTPQVKDSLYSQVFNANKAETDAQANTATILSQMAEGYDRLTRGERTEIAKTVDMLSLYPAGEKTLEQTTALVALDQVFGTRDKTLQVIDYYAQRNLPASPDPLPTAAPERYTNLDKPALTFGDPREQAKIIKESIAPGVASEVVSLRDYAEKYQLDKEQLLADTLATVENTDQLERLGELLGTQGTDAVLDQFSLNRVREEATFTSKEAFADALGEALTEYTSAPPGRRAEIAQAVEAYRPALLKRMDSANPVDRGNAERMLTDLDVTLDSLQNMDAAVEQFEQATGVTDAEAYFDQTGDETLGAKNDPVELPTEVQDDTITRYSKQSTAAKTSVPPKMTAAEKQAIIDQVVTMVGRDVQVLFDDLGGISGEYTKSFTKELIKISLSALNPMSVAHHESMHALFTRLRERNTESSRKLLNVLDQTTQRPEVISQLKALLHDSPEAIRDIESSMEERVAYSYQFWQAGLLKLEGATQESKPFWQKVKDFMARSLFAIIGVSGSQADVGKTQQIFNAFSQGQFAMGMSKPSLFADAINRVMRGSPSELNDTARQIMGPISDGFAKLTTATTDRLRSVQNEKLTEIADLFQPSSATGGGAQGFLSARSMQYSHFANKYSDMIQGHTADEVRDAARNLAAMKDPDTPLEHKFKALFDELFDYAIDADVASFNPETGTWARLQKVQHYFPRYWDEKAIVRNKDRLIDLMVEHNKETKTRKDAADYVEELLSSIRVNTNEYGITPAGRTPTAASAESRVTKFINERNAEAFLEYLDTDANRVMHQYIYQLSHRAEFTRRFGQGGIKIQDALADFTDRGGSARDLDTINRQLAALDGSIGSLAPQALKDAMGAMVTVQNMLLLGFTLFTSLVDPLGVAARTGTMGDAWRAYKKGVQGVFDQIKPSERRLAEEKVARWLGVIDDANMLDIMGITRDTTALARFTKKANAVLFRYNGMDQWTASMRLAAIEAGRSFLVENRNNERYLAEVGLTADDIHETRTGQLALYPEEIMEANPSLSQEQAQAISNRVKSAMNVYVDQSVIRPNAATMPAWMKDPRFMLIAHLKQFTFAFTNVVLARAKNEYNHGNTAPLRILALYVPFMLASDLARGVMTGADLASVDLPTMMTRALTRSGLLGVGSFGSDIITDAAYGKSPGTSLWGPTADHLGLLVQTMFGGAPVKTLAYRSIPNIIGTPLKNL